MNTKAVIILFLFAFIYSYASGQKNDPYRSEHEQGRDLAIREAAKGIMTYYLPVKETFKYRYYLPILKERLDERKIILWANEIGDNPDEDEYENERSILEFYKAYKIVMDSVIAANFGKNYINDLHKECKEKLKSYMNDSTEIRFRMCYNYTHPSVTCAECDIQDAIYDLLATDTLEGLVFGPEIKYFTTLLVHLVMDNKGMVTGVVIKTSYVSKDLSDDLLNRINEYVKEKIIHKLQLPPCLIGIKKFGTVIYNNKVKVALRDRQ